MNAACVSRSLKSATAATIVGRVTALSRLIVLGAGSNGDAGVKVPKRIAPETYHAFHDVKHWKLALLSCVLAKVKHQDAFVVLPQGQRS